MRRTRTTVRLALAAVIVVVAWNRAGAQEASNGAPPSEVVVAWLEAGGLPADSARVVGRAEITSDLEAVLVGIGLGYVPREHVLLAVPEGGGGEPWRIARVERPWDDVALELVSPGDVIVRITGGYGQEIYRQFFIDPARRAVIETREFRDPTPRALLVRGDTLYAAYDFHTLEGDPRRMHFLLRVVPGPGAVSVRRFFGDEPVEDLVVRSDTLYAFTEGSEHWLRNGAWAGRGRSRPLQPAAGVRLLHPRLPQFRIVPGGIVETRLADSLFVPLDLPDFDDFVRARPKHHEQVGDVEIETEIGPVTVHRDRVWFGLTFYDGEGMDGVGGIGWFDPESREARMIYPDSLAGWSVSAIEGHDGSIWVGRVFRGEGNAVGGGIGRYDLATGAFETFDVAGVTGAIAVREETVYALTDKGLVVLEPGKGVERYRVIPERRGAARVVVSREPAHRGSGEP